MKIQSLILLALLTLTGCASRLGTAQDPTFVISAPMALVATDVNDPNGDVEDMEAFEEDEFADFEEEFTTNTLLISDPLERWNRGVFRFNDRLYTWILRPFSKGYNAITPEPVRIGTRNFFHNLAMPVRAVNCLLQGKYKAAGCEVGRFAVNSVIGVFGCADPAEDAFGWASAEEDFGQTLAVWGVSSGPYLVWPIMGPGTIRDSSAQVGDYFLKPLNYADAWEIELVLKGLEYSNLASFSYEQYDLVKQEAIEPYVAMRNSYVQYRRKKILE